MAENPKVFISYSHDSSEHKRWVSEFAARLRHNGIDAILDQWDLGPGDDITRFIQRGIIDSDKVLVICTDAYVNKSNSGEGGVGYERMILNAKFAQDSGSDKFIPIIRQVSGLEKIPAFLKERIYVDFTNDSQFDEKFNELLHELHQMPVVQKPPLGKSPFASDELKTQLTDIPEQVESASDAYAAAAKIARAGDVLGWRHLIKPIRPGVFKSLVQWRQNELDVKQPENIEQLIQVMDKAVEIVSPLMTIALVGVESGREQFRDQKALLDDLLNIVGWDSSGYTAWVSIPDALGYVYHSLHGGLCLSTNQLNLALSLARVKVLNMGYKREYLHIWKKKNLVGWMDSLGSKCTEGWNYLANACEKWQWLSLIFGDELEYRISLVAYYMALNIHELASIIASGQQDILNGNFSSTHPFSFNVPLTFMSEDQGIRQRAISLLLRNPEAVTELWSSLNVTREQMENSWNNWIRLYEGWLSNVYGFGFYREIDHRNLFERF